MKTRLGMVLSALALMMCAGCALLKSDEERNEVVPYLVHGGNGRIVTPISLALDKSLQYPSNREVTVYGLRASGAWDYLNMYNTDVSGISCGLLLTCDSAVTGTQVSTLCNETLALYGIQTSGMLNKIYRDSFGVQIAGGVNGAFHSFGVQIAGGGNFALTSFGLQIAGVGNSAGNTLEGRLDEGGIAGAQVAGVFNDALLMYGLQAGALNRSDATMSGVQIGVANFADNAYGVQVGVYNNAVNLKGVQIGLLNRHGNCFLPVLMIGW
ncbi:MAG: hypothetical protein FWH21_07690 [Kiritimatiellaeota bacterium]|nr:hypothetical protein [Kiritimatiellota bacterium]